MGSETIADVVREMRKYPNEWDDRIEASYKSELQAHVKNFESTINNLVDENARLNAANARLKAANAKMREALLIIAGGKEARGNYEEVAWHMAQLAAEALAAEGEKK